MTVKQRIEDAEHLWSVGRREGAWVQTLIAAAATARLRYPRPCTDKGAFTQFICDIAGTIFSGDISEEGPTYIRFYTDNRGNHRKLEEIFYSELRCNLVHEAELGEVGFSQSRLIEGQYVATLTLPTEGPAEIPDFWVLHLIAAIKAAPENERHWAKTF